MAWSYYLCLLRSIPGKMMLGRQWKPGCSCWSAMRKLQGAEKEEMLRTMREMEAKLDDEIAANLHAINAHTSSHQHGFFNRKLTAMGVPKGKFREEVVGEINIAAMFCVGFLLASSSTERIMDKYITPQRQSPAQETKN
uniref:Uncharacterized protein n=2 Tax=Oryza TaxID=4527 RepID=A0A0E0Q3D1_ORYRU